MCLECVTYYKIPHCDADTWVWTMPCFIKQSSAFFLLAWHLYDLTHHQFSKVPITWCSTAKSILTCNEHVANFHIELRYISMYMYTRWIPQFYKCTYFKILPSSVLPSSHAMIHPFWPTSLWIRIWQYDWVNLSLASHILVTCRVVRKIRSHRYTYRRWHQSPL